MKNFKVTAKENNEIYWISRAVAVVGCIACVDIVTGNAKYLVSKRGPKVDNPNLWAFSCGYVDWDETLKEAVIREVYEELGLEEKYLTPYFDVNCWKVIDQPEADKRQNIVHRYCIITKLKEIESLLNNGTININSELRGGERNELSEIKLISIEEVDNYEWAFNHGTVIKEFDEYIRCL